MQVVCVCQVKKVVVKKLEEDCKIQNKTKKKKKSKTKYVVRFKKVRQFFGLKATNTVGIFPPWNLHRRYLPFSLFFFVFLYRIINAMTRKFKQANKQTKIGRDIIIGAGVCIAE